VCPHRAEGDSYQAISLAISEGKITPPAKLSLSLRGDLETILLKALRREPQERYATVEQFSEDLENYLTLRPIQARKGDRWYQTRKLLRRHWLPIAAAALSIGGLLAGLLVANQQRAIAQQRFVEVRQLANKLFDIDVEARQLPGSTKARQLIVNTSLHYLQQVSKDVQGDPELALEVGNAYMRVARVQGVPISANLGQMTQAGQNLRIAEKFVQSVLAVQPTNRTAMLRSAQIAHDRMLLARFNSRREEALAFARKSAEWLEKFHAGIGDKPDAAAILITYLNVADQEMLAGKVDESLRLCHNAVEVANMFHSRSYLGTFLWVSAESFRLQGRLDEALHDIRESVQVLEPPPGNAEQGRKMNFLLALAREGRILGEDNAISLGQTQEAITVLERAFRAVDQLVHQDAVDQVPRGQLAMSGMLMADILRDSEPERSLAIYDHILRHMAEVKNNPSSRRFEASALAGSSYALRHLGRSGEARQRLETAFERLRQVKSYPANEIKPGSEPEVTLCALADWEAAGGNIPRAIEIYEEVLRKVQASRAQPNSSLTDAVKISHLYVALAGLYRRAHHADLASDLESRRLALWRHWDAVMPHNAFVSRQF
jgi:tetratricopeptide (TPR) repeat protein